MPAKKKPLTKTESNKRYLARKKAKEFEAALEAPPTVIVVPEEPEEALPDDGIVVPPPTNTNFNDDDWQPYAPRANNVPLAKGETQETAIKPGDWHSPKGSAVIGVSSDGKIVETAVFHPDVLENQDKAVIKAQDTLEGDVLSFGHNLPDDTVERLEQAVEAIRWLSQKVKNLPPRTKEILRLRIVRLEELIRALQ